MCLYCRSQESNSISHVQKFVTTYVKAPHYPQLRGGGGSGTVLARGCKRMRKKKIFEKNSAFISCLTEFKQTPTFKWPFGVILAHHLFCNCLSLISSSFFYFLYMLLTILVNFVCHVLVLCLCIT